MVGSYFGATSWPGLSPFDHPLAGAWAGVALVHLWTLATAPSSAVTAVLRGFGGLGDEEWPRLRETVGKTALLGAHFLALAAIVHPGVDTHAMAPLLLGTASLLAHYGIARGGGLYFDLAAIELLVAAHADLFVPSRLGLDQAVWVVLGIRAALLAASTRVIPSERARARFWGTATACLAVLHVCHRPWSTTGLVAAAVLSVLTALVPRERRAPAGIGERLVVALLLATPTWLVCFGSGRWEGMGIRAALETEPLLRTLLTVLLTGVAARTVLLWAGRPRPEGAAVRAAHQVVQFLEDSGERVHAALLVAVSLAAGALLVGRYGSLYTTPELALFLVLLAGSPSSGTGEGEAAGPGSSASSRRRPSQGRLAFSAASSCCEPISGRTSTTSG